MPDETAEQKLARYEHVISAQMAEITKLREENERLKEGFTALGVLRSIYSDETQPTGHRIKAAIGAIDRETPRLTPQPPPMDLVAEEIEPLAVVVERQRKRMDRLQGQDIKVLPSGQVLLLDEPNGNGGNGNGSSD